jgi:tetratricopeptide (TPR) repeat protein
MSHTVPFPSDSVIYNVLGSVHAEMGNWPYSIKDFSKSIEVDPTNQTAYHYLTALFLRAGETTSYNRNCQAMLKQFAGTADPVVALQTAWDCLILPPSTNDLAAINLLIATARAGSANEDFTLNVELAKGLAEYRAGNFTGAVDRLQKAAAHPNDEDRTLMARLVLSMAQQQGGHADQAQKTLADALDSAGHKFPNTDSPDWNNRLTAQALMNQAKALVGVSESKDAAAK